MPKFEMPKFDIPKIEMPATVREFAERGVAQAKDTYEKMKAAAEEATDVLGTNYSAATKSASDYGLKVIEVARANTNAAFDFYGELIAVKSLSEIIELSNAHARKQFEVLTQQSKELSALAQQVASEAAKIELSTALNKRATDLTADELDRLAGEAWSNAAREALAKGHAVTGSRGGRRYRYHPDGQVDDLGPTTEPTKSEFEKSKKSVA